MTTVTSPLGQLNLCCVAINDQDRAVDFYVGQLGFEKRTDVPFGDGYRWIEVYPPHGSAGIALAPAREQDRGGAETGITLTTDDVDAAHSELRSRGVDVDEQVSRMGDPVPPMFWFRDPEGNSLMVVQLP